MSDFLKDLIVNLSVSIIINRAPNGKAESQHRVSGIATLDKSTIRSKKP